MSDRSRRDIHQDPMFREIVRAQLSRRSVLRGAGGVGVAAALAACGTGDTTGTTDPIDERLSAAMRNSTLATDGRRR